MRQFALIRFPAISALPAESPKAAKLLEAIRTGGRTLSVHRRVFEEWKPLRGGNGNVLVSEGRIWTRVHGVVMARLVLGEPQGLLLVDGKKNSPFFPHCPTQGLETWFMYVAKDLPEEILPHCANHIAARHVEGFTVRIRSSADRQPRERNVKMDRWVREAPYPLEELREPLRAVR